MAFVKAVRSKKRLRFGAAGLPGGGKTYSFLRMAHVLAHSIGKSKRVAVIDAEEGSASVYQGTVEDGITWDFETEILKEYSPVTYTTLIKEAGKAGFDCLIIDGLTQAWTGEGGTLDIHDSITKRSGSGNSYFAWREVSPLHNALVDAILRSPCHIFASLRVKMEYALDVKDGKSVPRRIGLKPIQREGMEYEFDLFGEFNDDENPVLTITKSRCFTVKKGSKFLKPGRDFIAPVAEWLSTGTVVNDELPTLTLFDTFYRRLLAADSLAELSEIGREVKAAQPQLKTSEYETLCNKAAAVKTELPAASSTVVVSAVPKAPFTNGVPPSPAPASEPVTPTSGVAAHAPANPVIEAGESLKFALMRQKIADAKTPAEISAAGREASGVKAELAAGEFEKLVALGKQRKEQITAAAAGKSPASA